MMMTTAVTRVASPRHQSSTANALAEPSMTVRVTRPCTLRRTAPTCIAAPHTPPCHRVRRASCWGLPLQRSRSARHRHTASAIAAAPPEHRPAVRLRLAATLAAAACVEAVACAVAGRVGTVTPPVQADAAVADAATPATAVVVAVTLQVRAAAMAATSTSPHIASPARQCRVLETRTCPAATAAVAIQAPAMTAPVVALVAVVTADDEVMWMTTGGGVAPHAVTVAAIALLPTMV